MLRHRVATIVFSSAFALALYASGSARQPAAAQAAPQSPQATAGAGITVDPLQWSYRIDRYRLAGDSGAARGEIIYYYKCWMCHNQYTKGAPYLKDLYQHSTLDSGQPVGDDTVSAQIKDGGPGMPAFRRKLPSVAPVLIVGITGMPGQNSAVTCLIASKISGLRGDGGLLTCIHVGVTEI